MKFDYPQITGFLGNIFKFLKAGIIIILLYFILLLIGYFYFDPFRIIYHYNNYSGAFIQLNWDYVSTEMYIQNKGKYNYNSFIFGSSRTIAYSPESWKKHLNASDSPYMFTASVESVYGIYKKLEYLDRTHAKIDNALIVLCRDCSFTNSTNHKGHCWIKDPVTSGESQLAFHKEFLCAYLTPRFNLSYYTYMLTKTMKPWMMGIDTRANEYDTVTNQVTMVEWNKELAKDPIRYYERRKKSFFSRSGEVTDSVQRIKPEQVYMLYQIARILQKHNTNYKVVISPLYEQVRFSAPDKRILVRLFGDHLYDFSGKNSFTDPETNYYEDSHYLPKVGDSIMNIIYKSSM